MTGSRIRILIVEDHLIARVGIATIINAQTDMCVAGEALDGRGALEQFRALRPDVVLMDMRMPNMDGIGAIAAIRREAPQARIIALSTYSGDQDIRRALEAGARAYLTKDTLHDELLRAIRTVYLGGTYLPAAVSAILAAQWAPPDLSARELEVLELIVRGLANKEIAAQLHIAEHTVKNHVKSILAKLGVDDRTQAATAALQRGIIHLH